MIPIRPWQLVALFLTALTLLIPLGGRGLDLAINGRTDLAIGSRFTPDRPLAPRHPVQGPVLTSADPIPHDGFTLHPVASFEIEALVLSRNRQHWPWADGARDLAPIDLALGWGMMSTPQEIAKLRIWQWGRFYYWRVRRGEDFNSGAAIPLSTNIHLISAKPSVRRALLRAREGDIILLKGKLVDARHPKMGDWRTSRTRTDTGNGACEILFVEQVILRPGRS